MKQLNSPDTGVLWSQQAGSTHISVMSSLRNRAVCLPFLHVCFLMTNKLIAVGFAGQLCQSAAVQRSQQGHQKLQQPDCLSGKITTTNRLSFRSKGLRPAEKILMFFIINYIS